MRKVVIQFNDEDPIEIGKTNDKVTWTIDEPGGKIEFTSETGDKFTIRLLEDDDNTT